MGEEALGVERLAALEHEVHRPGELRCDDREALALSMLGHQARAQRLRGLVGPQEAHRGFRERPFEVGVADLLARVPQHLARRALGRLHQAPIGQELLHAGKATNVLDLVEDGEPQHLAHAVDRAHDRQRHRVVRLGVGFQVPFQGRQPRS